MNTLRLSSGTTKRLLAETSRTATTTGARFVAGWSTSCGTAQQRRRLHADAPFLFSLPTDPEASMARSSASKSQSTAIRSPPSASEGAQTTPASSTGTVSSPDAPYILSMPPEFDVAASAAGGSTATSSGASAGGSTSTKQLHA